MTKKIRSSLLTSFNNCQRSAAATAYRDLVEAQGYELRPLKKGIGSSLGTAAHKGVEISLLEKMINGKPASLNTCIDSAIAELELIMSDGYEIYYDGITPTIAEAHRQIIEIQKAHYYFFMPDMNPVAVEMSLSAKLKNGYILTGHPDCIDANGTIPDLKTGVRETNAIAQLGSQSILARSNGYKVSKLELNNCPRTPKGKILEPSIVSYPMAKAEAIALIVANQVSQCLEGFATTQNKNSFSCNPSSILCSPNYCPAHGTVFCEYTYNQPEKRKLIDE